MDMYIGKRLDGRYEIEKLIGVGGMANVYKAQDLLEKRTVAVKILREEFLQNEDLVRRFKNESKAISQLNHPHIIKVFDVSVSDKVQYIAMEYLDGVTLKDYISQRGILTWKETLFFIEQVLGALQHAHSKGIVHRDIKPQNIMVLPDGNVKVMDFGIARFSRSESHTVTDKAIGSVHYISPEQAKGDVIDARADVYSTGVMMYEMLTGKLPFESESAVQVAIKQIADTPVLPREINPDIPKPLEAITMKAMAKEVRKRYQSAAEMEAAIQEFKKNPSIQFEYDYLDDNSPTRYIDKVVNKAKKTAKPAAEQKKGTRRRVRKNLTLPILAGLALAFAIGSAILCVLIFNTSGIFSKTEDVELVNFVGMDYSTVKADDNYSSFKFDVKEIYSADRPAGEILSQTPNPPKKVKEGSTIKIWVSKGTEIVTVPSLSGKSRGEAQNTLSEMGLSVLVISEENESMEAGKVIRTDPAEGTQLETGSEITLYVSRAASSTTTVPSLVGVASIEEARKLLDAAGLTMANPVEVENTAPAGTILTQSPDAGTEVQVGSHVTVTVSLGYVTPQPVTVAVTVNFNKYVTASHWTATVDGTVVSEFDSNGEGVWSFAITGLTPQTLTISNGSTTQSTLVDFLTSPGINFQISGAEPTPTPSPTPAPTPTPTPEPTPPEVPQSTPGQSTGVSASSPAANVQRLNYSEKEEKSDKEHPNRSSDED
ncbi:MAG: Stk1 family PASTA domain-containing Ser/Thr kinase [Pygmaiobacter massiliensis]|nr:Stk1 family PASTA domain-containing Ser/Thr kinase [Pygmaiobacter massiliensis]